MRGIEGVRRKINRDGEGRWREIGKRDGSERE